MISNNDSHELFRPIPDSDKMRNYQLPPLLEAANSQLFASPDGLTCFAHIDVSPSLDKRRNAGIAYFLDPCTVVWKVGVRDAFAPASDGRKAPTLLELLRLHKNIIRLFVQPKSGSAWYDMGPCKRSTISGSRLNNEDIIDDILLRLPMKLPEPLWLLFGGHPGWWLSINTVENEASAPDSVLRAVRAAWTQPTVDLEITRYAGDTLFAIADESGHATVDYLSDQGFYVSRAAQPPLATHKTYFFPRSDNYDHEVPVEQVISREEALSIIEAFVLTGQPHGLEPLSRDDR